MATRAKKKTVPYTKANASGVGGGDRGSPNTGRAITSRFNSAPQYSQHFEGIYRNRRMIQIMTSLIGCEIEVELLKDGLIYIGILRTISPQMDFAIELASIKPPPGQLISKSSITQTLVVKWSEVARVTATEDSSNTSQKDIFKIDTDISTETGPAGAHLNGHGERKELERFQFDDTSPLKDLDEEDTRSKGWTVEEMFVTNEEKFNVGSTFNPDMPDYTTPLVLTESDQSRIEKANLKAREIESSSHDVIENECSKGEERSEEDLYSAVVREEIPQKTLEDEEEESQSLKSNEVLSVNTHQQLQTNGKEGDGEKVNNVEEEEEEKAKDKEKDIQDENEKGQGKECLEEGEGLSPSSSPSTVPSSSDVTAQSSDIDSSVKELKPAAPRPFKLNPDAQEFKPFTPPSSAPPTNRFSRQSKGAGQRQQQQQRSNVFTPQDQTALYGGAAYMTNATPTIRLMQGQPAAGPLTSPTGLVSMIRPMHGSQIIGHQGNQFYSIPTSLPGTPNHATFNQAGAILGHPAGPHGLGMAAAAPQGNLVYVPVPYGPPYIPAGPIPLSYPQPQGGGGGK
ncbi:PREDICTED: ataxin-2-like [Amphimedon queenslandica]|uniref:LsmAD domain-containing protein n=1 Tax=Amphimedon queenslandica TaxID=400682 RepID=A0AAN0IPD4_AMPQE|nr:PREDICTED: ataxin-2-like [Amphimedon queenslandica]|eukprot:XP_011405973.2 PREDICTED: ataxin-2-like [Amphimedon queenslandica]